MRMLREGFTTGSCAAAAALASCLWQREGRCPAQVELRVPEGRSFSPEIIPYSDYACGVVKDAGDDPDITNGMVVIARVTPWEQEGPIIFCAGKGVGVVTERGLKVAQGEPAINPVPRSMIENAVRSVFGQRGARVEVSIPGGEEIADRTFNPRLGIRGGLSILGTSGIVRPMSEEALKASLYAELQMRARQGVRILALTFGNQGEAAVRQAFPGLCVVQASNEMGFMLDSALELGLEQVLIAGHPGKLVKLSAGVMQTHSRTADARREVIVAHLALMGAPVALLERVMSDITTDAAIAQIHLAGFDGVWNRLARAARDYCSQRVRNSLGISVVFLEPDGNVLGKYMEAEA